MRAGRHAATAAGLALTLMVASVATADDVVLSGDDISAGDILAFGTVCVGDDVSTVLEVMADRQGGGAQVWANAATLAISASGPTGVLASTTSLALPADWVTTNQSVDNAKSAGPVDLDVSLDTSTSYTLDGTLTVSATGARNGGGSLTRSDALTVSATVQDCGVTDATAPAVVPTVSGALGNDGWYVGDVTVSWGVSDGESAITSTSGCETVVVDTDTAGRTVTCQATSAGGTTSESVTIRRDATAPTILASRTPEANGDGWNNGSVAVDFTCGDLMSGVASCGPDTTLAGEGADQSASGTAVDAAGNAATATVDGISIDSTRPLIDGSSLPLANANGWNSSPVTVTFSCTDGLAGIRSCTSPVTLGEGADQSATGTAVDRADNSDTATVAGIDVDLTDPTVWLVGGPADGGTYYPHVMAGMVAPTCDAADALSGVDGPCAVTGYSTSVGTHTVRATVSDLAGNDASASRTYTVDPYTLGGFSSPVDMGGTWNTVKGGSTVPLKFEVFAGATEMTSTSVITGIAARRVGCTTADEDAVETTATGGTSLRYDTLGGQYVYNWQTPRGAGLCYVATVTVVGGQTISANFKTK